MHCFSNTGWLAYCGLLGDLAAARPEVLAAIRGVVIDSAPFPAMSPEVWAAGFLTAAGSKKKNAARKARADAAALKKRGGKVIDLVDDGAAPSTSAPTGPDRDGLAFKATSAFFRVWMQGARKRALKGVIAAEAAHAAWPALYIFCEDDHVIPAASVREAAAAHAARGAGAWAARTLCFQSSEHVAHLVHHRAAYTAALDAFVSGDVLKVGGGAAVAAAAFAPAAAVPVAPLVHAATSGTGALGRSLSRSLSFKLDPAAASRLARSASIKAGPGNGGGLQGLPPILAGRGALTHAGSIRAAATGEVVAGSPTAAMVAASLRAALPQLM